MDWCYLFQPLNGNNFWFSGRYLGFLASRFVEADSTKISMNCWTPITLR